MPGEPVSTRFKEYANNIVGKWYNRIPDEVLQFSFLNELTKEAELITVLHGEATKATYNFSLTFNDQWYLQIWSTEGKKNGIYKIEILTASILTVSNIDNKVTTYHRKVDYAFANQLLEIIEE